MAGRHVGIDIGVRVDNSVFDSVDRRIDKVKANAEQLNKIVGHNKFNPETASKVFNFIEEHQDLANILDYVGSGRKMSLISELDDDLISKNEEELNEYLKSISSTGDFDYYEIERILTQGKAEKEE